MTIKKNIIYLHCGGIGALCAAAFIFFPNLFVTGYETDAKPNAWFYIFMPFFLGGSFFIGNEIAHKAGFRRSSLVSLVYSIFFSIGLFFAAVAYLFIDKIHLFMTTAGKFGLLVLGVGLYILWLTILIIMVVLGLLRKKCSGVPSKNSGR